MTFCCCFSCYNTNNPFVPQVWRIRPVSNPRVRDPSSDASSSSSSDAATPDLLSQLEEITQEVQQEIGGEGGKLETEAWGDGEIVVSRR